MDLSDGGLLVALAEMAMASGTGIVLAQAPSGLSAHGWWFGEDQARYVLAVQDPEALLALARSADVSARVIGRCEGDGLTLPLGVTISVEALRQAHGRFFAEWMRD